MSPTVQARPRRRRVRAAVTVVLLAGLAPLAGCGSGAESGTSAGPAVGQASAAAAPTAAGGADVRSAAGVATDQGGTTLTSQPRLVRTAEITVQVQNLAAAAALVRAAAVGLGGSVASETTSYATFSPLVTDTGSGTGTDTGSGTRPAGGTAARPGESVIVVRVPQPSLDRATDKVAAIGKELGRTSSSQDVTGDLADLESRVKTQRASVDRVRTLLARATDLNQVVLLESELSKRETELEAAQARQAALADRADLATLTVDLRTPEVTPAGSEPDSGFLAGLRGGWHAVIVSTTVVLTVLGGLLPWVVVALVLGWPALLLARRLADRRRARAVPAGPGPWGGPGVAGPPGPPPWTPPAGPAPAAPVPAGVAAGGAAPGDAGRPAGGDGD